MGVFGCMSRLADIWWARLFVGVNNGRVKYASMQECRPTAAEEGPALITSSGDTFCDGQKHNSVAS